MFIAHLPAGYLLGRSLVRVPEAGRAAVESRNRLLAIGIGSVFPDVDMMWFYLVDHQRTHHHLYWTHLPAFWLLAAVGFLLASAAGRSLRPPVAMWFFLLGVFLHLALDSIVGGIYWQLPFDYRAFSLFEVHRHLSPWYLNFIFHWVFGLELILVGCAATLAWRDSHRYREMRRYA